MVFGDEMYSLDKITIWVDTRKMEFWIKIARVSRYNNVMQ